MNENHDYQLVQTADIEKINFWKAQGRLSTIPWELLELSGYIKSYGESVVVGSVDGKTVEGKVRNVPEGTEILFWSPQERMEKMKLEEILVFLEEKKQAIHLAESIISRFTEAKRGDDVKYLQRGMKRIKAPTIAINGRINAFFDTLRFRVSEVGMTELRQMPFRARYLIEQRERELNDD